MIVARLPHRGKFRMTPAEHAYRVTMIEAQQSRGVERMHRAWIASRYVVLQQRLINQRTARKQREAVDDGR